MAWRVDVVVAPVTVDPDGIEGEASLPVLRGLVDRDGQWIRGPLEGGGPDARARALFMESVPPLLAEVVPDLEQSLRPVTFHADAGRERIELLYTVALPMAVGGAIGKDDSIDWLAEDRWVGLSQTTRDRKEAAKLGSEAVNNDVDHALPILDHWRQLLEETAAALLFLGRYFTMTQLRDVYSSVWGYEQDATGFRTWARRQFGNNGQGCGAIAPLPDPREPDLAREMAQAMGGGDLLPMILGVARKRDWYGMSWQAIKSLGDIAKELVNPEQVIRAGSTVAYQATDQGPAPEWFLNTTSERGLPATEIRLASIYRIRPTWQYPPPKP